MTTRFHTLLAAIGLLAILTPVGTESASAGTDLPGDEFWSRGLGVAGNGDIEVYDGMDTTDPGLLLWAIEGGIVRETDWMTGGADVLVIAVLDDNSIGMPGTNTVSCEVEEAIMSFGPVFKVRDRQTNVVEVSLFNRFVFSGDVNPTSAADLMSSFDLVYEFDQDQIKYPDGEVAVTATAGIQAANPMRRATLAALLVGACGSRGLPTGY
jgi:hypothetical protein